MTHQQLARMLTKTTTPAFQRLMVKRERQIRRAVENVAWHLLDDCPQPTQEFDGEQYYVEEHWELTFEELYSASVEHLAERGWAFEAGDITDRQIAMVCEVFLRDMEDMVECFREDYHEYCIEQYNERMQRRASNMDIRAGIRRVSS